MEREARAENEAAAPSVSSAPPASMPRDASLPRDASRASAKAQGALEAASFEHALVGIDENGLGPRLGPLLVTAVAARANDEGRSVAYRKARGKLAELLADSKKLVGFGDSSLGEAWARALAARAGVVLSSPSELLRHLSIDADHELRARCPKDHEEQCWRDEDERFTADDTLVTELAKHLARLDAKGLVVHEARIAIVCTERLNEAARRGVSRFDVDLHAMERLTLDLRARSPKNLTVVCGKVGGIDRYSSHFGPFASTLHSPLCEGRDRSEYAVAGVGTVAFVKDADDGQLLVSLASLVGKWARDVLMHRIVRHHQRFEPELPLASGYHDPVTARFIHASRLHRERRGLPDDCFERRAVGPAAEAAEAGAP